MATERQQKLTSPEKRLSTEQLQEATDLGIRPITFIFLIDCIKNNLYSELEPKVRKVIFTYFSTNKSLEDVSSLAQVETTQAVSRMIRKGMKEMWQKLPEDLKEQYPEEETIVLKNPHRKPSTSSIGKVVESRREKREQRKTSQRS